VKGRPRTAEEVRLHDQVASLGCICCRLDGVFNPVVSIHHANGRTKPFAHQDVLPLCGPHHQKIEPGVLAIHGDKRRWEAKYGNQYVLIQLVMDELGYPYVALQDRDRTAMFAAKNGVDGAASKRVRRGRHASAAKPRMTEEQLRLIADAKDKRKVIQQERRARYESENKDIIEARKTVARNLAKELRRSIAATKKENAKASKRSAKSA
jgi:hypothetical protein